MAIDRKIKTSLFLILIVAFFNFYPLYLVYSSGITYKPSFYSVSYYVFDTLITFISIFIVTFYYFKFYVNVNECLGLHMEIFFEKNKLILFFLIFLAIYVLYERFNGLDVFSISREVLLYENSGSRIIWFLTPFFTFTFSISVAYGYKKRLIFIFFIGLISVSLYEFSRSQLLTSSYLILIMFAFNGRLGTNFYKLIVLASVVLLFGSYMSVLQHRADNLAGGLNSILSALFKYRSFSIALSDRVIDVYRYDYEQVLFPFFGFFAERGLGLISALSNPVAIQGSTFVTDFISLGNSNSYDANVLYPWFSWFVAIYGFSGLIIKFVFVLLLFFLVKGKAPFISLYLLYIVVIYGSIRHPLLDNVSAYYLISILFCDFVFICKRKGAFK